MVNLALLSCSRASRRSSASSRLSNGPSSGSRSPKSTRAPLLTRRRSTYAMWNLLMCFGRPSASYGRAGRLIRSGCNLVSFRLPYCSRMRTDQLVFFPVIPGAFHVDVLTRCELGAHQVERRGASAEVFAGSKLKNLFQVLADVAIHRYASFLARWMAGG